MNAFGNRWIAIALYSPAALGAVACALAGVLVGAPSTFVLATLAVYVLGFLMLLQALRSIRARRARAGARAESGPVRMTPSNRMLYRIGNLLLLLGTVVTFILYNVTFA